MALLPIIFGLLLVHSVGAKLFTLEVENYAPKEMRMARSSASGNFTVLFHNAENIQVEFCLRISSTVNIREITYSNDGPVDTIRTLLDGTHSGSFTTTFDENGGNGWNILRKSGRMQETFRLSSGRHYLTVSAPVSDVYGVEIDNVVLDIDDNNMEYTDLLCNLYCFNNIKYIEAPRKDYIPSGRFVQKSTSTQCSEQDNIKVEMYHDSSKEFEISTHLPKYISFSNSRDPNYDNCVLASPYWRFVNQTVIPNKARVTIQSAYLDFSGTAFKTFLTVTFNFKRLTPTREIDERYIGSVLYVKLRNMPRENVRVNVEYRRQGSWSSLGVQEFSPFEVERYWNVPDRTWDVSNNNQIRLEIEPGKQQVLVEDVKLSRRNSEDTTFEIHADSDFIYQGVRLGFWHNWGRHPKSMSVQLLNGDTKPVHTKVDSLRIYAKVPWTGGFSQVCVIFQDGRVRLQTITPHGLDYIPFGSSVYIGQPITVDSERPYIPIKNIYIDTNGPRLLVQYEDGNGAVFYIRTTFTQTFLQVKEVQFKKNRQVFPVMTLKSMWISDGNSDVDHVTINGDESRHVTSKWNELYGITAVFFRKCISQHNTQAPDLKLKFL